MPRRLPLLSVLFFMLAAPAGIAVGQPAARPAPDTARMEAQEVQAKQACEGGRVQDGVRLLTELLNQTKDGTYIFNLARCYQQNGQLDQALVHFRAYLRRPDVDPAAAAKAREYIAVIERSPPPAPTPPPPATAPPATGRAPLTSPAAPSSAPAPLAATPPAAVATAVETPPVPGRALRIGGLAVGGAGLASLAVGLYYTRQVYKLDGETERARVAGDKDKDWFDRQNGKGERAEKRQWLFLGIGATGLAAGGVLYYLGWRAGDSARATTLVPVALPGGGGGALLTGTF